MEQLLRGHPGRRLGSRLRLVHTLLHAPPIRRRRKAPHTQRQLCAASRTTIQLLPRHNTLVNVPPTFPQISTKLFLGGCFRADPEQRLTVPSILERLGAIAESNRYDLKAPLCISKSEPVANDVGHGEGTGNGPRRPPPPRPQAQAGGQVPNRPPPPGTVRNSMS